MTQGELEAKSSLREKYTRNALRLQKLENTYNYATRWRLFHGNTRRQSDFSTFIFEM